MQHHFFCKCQIYSLTSFRVTCSLLDHLQIGTTSLDQSTLDRSPFDRGRLWLDYDPQSIWYHWTDYLDLPVIEVKIEFIIIKTHGISH